MTTKQEEQIEIYRKQFIASCEKYESLGHSDDCGFVVLKSERPEDKNITIVATTITGMSDTYQPYFKTVNLMIEPDGNVVSLSDIYDKNQVITYVQSLKKIN